MEKYTSNIDGGNTKIKTIKQETIKAETININKVWKFYFILLLLSV